MDMLGGKATDKTRLLTLGELDGRTIAARNVRTLIDSIESDLGGSDRLSAAEREIVRRAALASAMLEHQEAAWLTGGGLDVGAYTALANLLRRLLTTVGLERRPRDVTPDLDKYIAAKTVTVIPPPPQ
jgi:hypothetical protein